MESLKKICCIPGCFENGRSHQTLHNFPNPVMYPDLFRTWLYAAGSVVNGLDSQNIYQNFRICRFHFEKKYRWRSNRIRNTAVPTINMPGLTTMPQFPVLDCRPIKSTNNQNDITQKVKEPVIHEMDTSSCNFANKDGAKDNRTSDVSEQSDTRSIQKETLNMMDDDLCNDQLNIPSPSPASPDTCSTPTMTPITASVEILSETTEEQNLILKKQNLKLKEQNLILKEQNLKVKEQNLSRKEQSLKIKEDMLKLLYNVPNTDARGPPINEDIATSWHDILANGLPPHVKDSHMRSYQVPSNCEFLAAPDVNIEMKEGLQGTVVMTDSMIKCKQNQLGIALSALATATELIMSNEKSKQKVLQPISDACHLLCDNHYMETETRRNLIISAVNSEVRDVLGETERSKLLFGDDVEKLKAVKNILKTNTLKRVCRPEIKVKIISSPSVSKGHVKLTPVQRKTDC